MSFASLVLTSDSRTHHQDAIEDSESIHVARKFEEQEKATNTVADNDRSKSTSPKQGSSVVSALLATACVAAVAFEAASEYREKERSQHAEVKRDEGCDRVVRDCDSPVGTEPARIIEDNNAVMIEKSVTVNHTAQQTVVVDSLPKTVITPTPVAMTLCEAQTEIRRSRS